MLEIRRVTAAETRPLRQRILRPHQRPEELVYDGDDDPRAAHFGGFLSGALVATASIYPSREGRAYQLRGMAVDQQHQGKGHGGALLHACLAHAQSTGANLIWCNARTTAVPFYRRHGFHTVGAEFDLPTIGPHYVMEQTLAPSSPEA